MQMRPYINKHNFVTNHSILKQKANMWATIPNTFNFINYDLHIFEVFHTGFISIPNKTEIKISSIYSSEVKTCGSCLVKTINQRPHKHPKDKADYPNKN